MVSFLANGRRSCEYISYSGYVPTIFSSSGVDQHYSIMIFSAVPNIRSCPFYDQSARQLQLNHESMIKWAHLIPLIVWSQIDR